MNKQEGHTKHHRGNARTWFGLGIALVALFWLAKKIGWLGAGSSGIIWPLLVFALGLMMVLARGSHHRKNKPAHHGGDR